MKIFSAIYVALLLALTVAVMFEPAKWATTIPEVLSLALLAAWSVWALLKKQELRLSAALIPLAGVILLACLQLGFNTTVYQWPTRLSLFYWSGNFAIFFCGLQFLADPSFRDRYLRFLTYFGFGVALLSTIQALTSQGKVYWFFTTKYTPEPVFGPFLYRNQYAAFMELLLPVAIYFAITSRKRRFVFLAIAAVMYGSVIFCASRAGFLLCTVELAAVPLIAFRRHGGFSRAQLINGGLALIALLLWLAIPAGPDVLIRKFGSADPYTIRREFNASSLRMIQARPVLGFGLGNWPTAYPGFATFDDGLFANQAHNDWAQWAVEGGIPLFILMLGLGLWGARAGFRTGWGFGIPIVFVHCFSDYPIQRPGVAVLFFLILAAQANAGRLTRSGSRESR